MVQQVYSTRGCDLPGLMKDVTGVQYKSTKDCDLPGLMKDMTGVQKNRLLATWINEGCNWCIAQETVTYLD